MKKNLSTLVLVLAATLMVVSCKKKEEAPKVEVATEMAPTAPPVVNASILDPAIIQKVNDAIKDIHGAKAEDVNGVLTITGEVSASDARKLKMSVDALKLEKVDFKQTIKK